MSLTCGASSSQQIPCGSCRLCSNGTEFALLLEACAVTGFACIPDVLSACITPPAADQAAYNDINYRCPAYRQLTCLTCLTCLTRSSKAFTQAFKTGSMTGKGQVSAAGGYFLRIRPAAAVRHVPRGQKRISARGGGVSQPAAIACNPQHYHTAYLRRTAQQAASTSTANSPTSSEPSYNNSSGLQALR